jgi:uncharacterized protein (DUF305 family)
MIRKFLALVVASLALVGCVPQDQTGEFSGLDVMFAQMMIPHHEQAVLMSELAPSRSSDPEVLAIASEIRDAQQPEIEQMKGFLERAGVGLMPANSHAGHNMAGMLTDEQLAALEAATGVEFDRLFLEGMIEHHEGAIVMAEDVVDSKNPEVAALAKAIISAQQDEIARMQSLLSR